MTLLDSSPAPPLRDASLRRSLGASLPTSHLANTGQEHAARTDVPESAPGIPGSASGAPPSAPATAVSLGDYELLARQHLSPMAYDYVAGGAADELTLRWNVDAFAGMRLRPRILVDVGPQPDMRVRLFGSEFPTPIVLAPTAYHRLMHAEGELATARGAAAAGVAYCVSTATTTALGEIAAAADGVRWFQLYPLPDRERTRALVQEAEASGCRAICLTVDTPVSGVRNREQRAQLKLPDGVVAPYFHHIADQAGATTAFRLLTWDDVGWLRSVTRLPVLLKGVLTGEDARIALSEGAHGLVVSNHGARNLDTLPATIHALPEVAEAVEGRVPVLMDGGIRRGTDVLKAIALGASAVMIGRPYLYGLAVAGAAGVADVVRILAHELELAMVLTGRASLAALDATVLWEAVQSRFDGG